MMKRIVIISLALILGFSLVACSVDPVADSVDPVSNVDTLKFSD